MILNILLELEHCLDLIKVWLHTFAVLKNYFWTSKKQNYNAKLLAICEANSSNSVFVNVTLF